MGVELNRKRAREGKEEKGRPEREREKARLLAHTVTRRKSGDVRRGGSAVGEAIPSMG